MTVSQSWYWTGVCVLLAFLVLLLWRNPFSERSLIPNFEPFPDSFHYIVPARSFLEGKGLFITRAVGDAIAPSVPPLYSLILIPVFFLFTDPRILYFVNVMLALVSFFVFERVMTELFSSKLLKLFLLFLFVTSAPFSWVPTLAMAENLLLPVFLIGCYWLVAPLSQRKVLLAGVITWGFYATKYSAAPFTAVFFCLYLWKIWRESPAQKRKKWLVEFLLSTTLTASVFFLFEYLQKGRHPLQKLFFLIEGWLHKDSSELGGSSSTASSFFSFSFVQTHWPAYWHGFFGGEQAFLWTQTRFLPIWTSILGGGGVLWTLFKEKRELRWFAAGLFLFALGQLSFMSTFYVVDLRFIYVLFPVVIIGLGWFVQELWKTLPQNWTFLPALSLLLLSAVLFLPQAQSFKRQIAINLKYAETPWYYIGIGEVDSYMSTQKFETKPVVITAVSPFLFDFYQKTSFDLLPLADEQEFRGQEIREKVWGPGDYSDLFVLYDQVLAQGRPLYFSNAGLGNEQPLRNAFAKIMSLYETEKVHTACFDTCNLYKIHRRKE